MRTQKIVCDVCGAEVANEDHVSLVVVSLHRGISCSTKALDLCDTCVEGFGLDSTGPGILRTLKKLRAWGAQ